MMFVIRILNSMVLKVKLPMKIEIYNKGEKDITHNWSVGGRLIHVELKQYLFRSFKNLASLNVIGKEVRI